MKALPRVVLHLLWRHPRPRVLGLLALACRDALGGVTYLGAQHTPTSRSSLGRRIKTTATHEDDDVACDEKPSVDKLSPDGLLDEKETTGTPT